MKRKVLFDTNIIILREDCKSVPSNLTKLLYILNELDIKALIHPYSYEDISRDNNIERKRNILSKILSYSELKSPLDPSEDQSFLTTLGYHRGSKVEVDDALLYAVYTDAISFLITEDKEMYQKKACTLNISDRVLTIDEAIAKFERELPPKDEHLTWHEAWSRHIRENFVGAHVKFVNRNDELVKLKSALDNPNIRVILVTGPQNIGKSRLVLEATKERSSTYFFLTPRSITLRDLPILKQLNEEVLAVIEEPDLNIVEQFAKNSLEHSNIKFLIILEAARYALLLGFRESSHVEIVSLASFSDEHAYELLNVARAKFDLHEKSWVVTKAGGNPGYLLIAASLGSDLRTRQKNFVKEIANSIENKAREMLGDDAIQILQLLSLLTQVGVKGPVHQEIEIICKIFGTALKTQQEVLNSLSLLEKGGYITCRGGYVEVIPQIFANRLAAVALSGHSEELFELFDALGQDGKLRLINRLKTFQTKETGYFWNVLFSPNGLFRNLYSALSNSNLLYPVAVAFPKKVMSLIELELQGATVQERRLIASNARRGLVLALQELLFHKSWSASAIRHLALLAEAENENYISNNATGVFCNYFYSRHPQVPVKLSTRYKTLKNLILDEENSVELRLIGIQAIESAIQDIEVVLLQPSGGMEPLDPQPEEEEADVLNYVNDLVGLLRDIVEGAVLKQAEVPPTLAEKASILLPHANFVYAHQTLRLYLPVIRLNSVVSRFEDLTDWTVELHKFQYVSALNEALELTCKVIDEQIKKREKITVNELKKSNPKKIQSTTELTQNVDRLKGSVDGLKKQKVQLKQLINRLNDADFPIKLRKWAGGGLTKEYREAFSTELRSLAEEALKNPGRITDDLLSWLCSGEAKNSKEFFLCLGRLDLTCQFIELIERIENKYRCRDAFAHYLLGISYHNCKFVSQYLNGLAEMELISAEAISMATIYTSCDSDGLQRIEKLILENKIDPLFVVRRITRDIRATPSKFYRLIKLAAGPNLEKASAIIDFIDEWSDQRPITGRVAKFAWRCLEAQPSVTLQDQYIFDNVASKLAQTDIEQGFELLEKLLRQPDEKQSWDPLPAYLREHKFWDVLWAADHERAIRIALEVALTDQLLNYRITSGLRNVLNQEEDASLLMNLAYESERQAELIAQCIVGCTIKKPRFWDIAFKIVDKYPNNMEIQNALTENAGPAKRGWKATTKEMEDCYKEIKRIRNDPTTPESAQHWIEQLEIRMFRRLSK